MISSGELPRVSPRIIREVKLLRLFVLAALAAASACTNAPRSLVRIIDAGNTYTLTALGQTSPRVLLARAGLSLAAGDRILVRGYPVEADATLEPSDQITIQIQHPITLIIDGKTVLSTARTVGEALFASGLPLYAADEIEPPAGTPTSDGMTVRYVPSRQFAVAVDQRTEQIRSAASTVGAVLAGAGNPLVGLDFSQPAEDQAVPDNGQIRVVRVSEAILLAQTTIPFDSDLQASSQVELDHQQVLQPGEPGLAISRTRIQYQDGQEVSRLAEPQTIVRPPIDRILAYGTKVVVHTATIDGVNIQYWRAVQMFATAYSPCNSAPDRCYPGTSSGKPVQKGVVAVRYSWYLAMQGQAIYIPGYGSATIEDVCGGCVGKPWIDLGYTDQQFAQEGGQWGKYVTVYFLAPPPANILYDLQ